MVRLQKMHHLVNHDVFEALLGLLRQFCIKPDVLELGITAAPLCFHSAYEKLSDPHPQDRPPFGDERGNLGADELSIATVENGLPLVGIDTRPHPEDQAPRIQLHGRFGVRFLEGQQVATAPNVVTLAFNVSDP